MNISLNSPQGGASSDARNGADRPRQQQHQGEERKKFQQLSEILAVVKGKIRLTPDSRGNETVGAFGAKSRFSDSVSM